MKRFARAGFSWAIGILGFALVCLLAGKLFPQEVAGISPKVRRFAEQKTRIDTLFVGSSRIYHGIDPKTFDQTMAAQDHPMHSFNAGMDGMSTAEGFALVRRLRSLHPRKLKYVFFEAQAAIAAGTPTGGHKAKERDVYWRDWHSVREGARIFAQGLTWPGNAFRSTPLSVRRLELFGPLLTADVRLWLRNATHVGAGREILQHALAALPRLPGEKKRKPAPVEGANLPPDWKGYFAMAKPMAGENLSNYRQKLIVAQNHPAPQTPDLLMRGELKRFAQEMAAQNIQVIFVVPPSLLAARGSGIHVPDDSLLLAYDDLVRYPQFFAEANRLDPEHLNARGAEIFSRTLAEDFSSALTSKVR